MIKMIIRANWAAVSGQRGLRAAADERQRRGFAQPQMNADGRGSIYADLGPARREPDLWLTASGCFRAAPIKSFAAPPLLRGSA
jgi:hypothetical protein